MNGQPFEPPVPAEHYCSAAEVPIDGFGVERVGGGEAAADRSTIDRSHSVVERAVHEVVAITTCIIDVRRLVCR